MWIKEGCKVVEFPINFIKNNVKKTIADYVNNVFNLAYNIPTYLILEPIVIPTKMHYMKRFITIPPLSVAICHSIEHSIPGREFIITDGVWAEVGIVAPYTNSGLCGSAKALDVDLDEDRDRGLPYLCTNEPTITSSTANLIVNGGLIEITKRSKASSNKINIEISQDAIQLFIKNLIDIINNKSCTYMLYYEPIITDKYLRIGVSKVASVDDATVTIKIGRGFVFSFDPNPNPTYFMYYILMLLAYVRPPDPANVY